MTPHFLATSTVLSLLPYGIYFVEMGNPQALAKKILKIKEEYFINKSKKFSEFLGTKSLREAILELENQ